MYKPSALLNVPMYISVPVLSVQARSFDNKQIKVVNNRTGQLSLLLLHCAQRQRHLADNGKRKFDDKSLLRPWANLIKLFAYAIYKFSYKARVFVLAKPFQPSLMFVGRARAYPCDVLHSKVGSWNCLVREKD